MHTSIIFILLFIAGLIGGFLNAVASSGTAVMLPILILLGIHPSTANATNRIPVVVGFISSTINFHRAGLINWKKVFILSIASCSGAIIGVTTIEHFSDENISKFLIFALLISLTLVITKFKNISFVGQSIEKPITYKTLILFFGLGIWGGMIVLDTATFILFSLTLHLGFDLTRGNAMKSAICLILASMTLILFDMNGSIDWTSGIIISIGSFIGGYIGSKLALSGTSKNWIFKLLISVIIFEIISFSYNALLK